MTLREPLFGALLVVSFAAAPCLSQEAASLEQRRGEQHAVLTRYRLNSPPDLAAFGLVLRDGDYYSPSRAAPGQLPVTGPELASKIEALMRAATGRAAMNARLSDLQRRLPTGAQAALGDYFENSRPAGAGSIFPRDGFGAAAAPAPGVRSLLYRFQGTGDASRIEGELNRLVHSDQGRVVDSQTPLTQLAGYSDPLIRRSAVSLLGRLHDETLAPLFAEKLEDPDVQVRARAASALQSIIAATRYRSGTWDEYIQKAPPLLTLLARARASAGGDSWGLEMIGNNLDNFNLMDEGQKRRFVDRFDDPKALLALIASSRGGEIDAARGLHTPEAQLIHERLLALLGSKPLSAVLTDASWDEAARTSALARLNRYDLLKEDLKADPRLAAVLPRLLFPDERAAGLNGSEVFSIGDVAWQTKGVEFSNRLIEALKGMTPEKKGDALLFLQLNRARLSDNQKKVVDDLSRQVLPEAAQRRIKDHDAVPFYSHWPDKKLNVGMVMTQADSARGFVAELQKDHYAIRSGSLKAARLDLVKSADAGEISIDLEVMASNKHGWAQDRGQVTTELAGFYASPSYQVAVYRGHIGDYKTADIQAVKTQDKVFMNLGCDSASSSRRSIENCDRCAYFGTTTTAEGSINDVFLRTILEALSRRLPYDEIEKTLARALPATAYRFTGSYSASGLWGELAGRG